MDKFIRVYGIKFYGRGKIEKSKLIGLVKQLDESSEKPIYASDKRIDADTDFKKMETFSKKEGDGKH